MHGAARVLERKVEHAWGFHRAEEMLEIVDYLTQLYGSWRLAMGKKCVAMKSISATELKRLKRNRMMLLPIARKSNFGKSKFAFQLKG